MHVDTKWSGKILLLVLLGVLVFTPAVGASRDGTMKHVLLLFSYKRGVPGLELLEKTIISTLEAGTSERLEFYVEYMDVSRFEDEEYQRRLYDLYQRKYSALTMDLLIPLQIPALDFLLQHGEKIFPGAPIVFSGVLEKNLDNERLTQNVTGVTQGIDVPGTVEIALKLHPGTRHIAVITGASPVGREIEKIARKVFRRYEEQFNVQYLSGLPMGELLEWVERPPEQTILFYFPIHEDGIGEMFLPVEALEAIFQVADAPMYAFLDVVLGHGIVGGHLSSVEAIGARTAEIGLRILQGEQAVDIPILRKADNVYMFDWRQLKHWGIREDDLPPESIVRYKESSLWDRYKWYILGTITLILLETFLLIVMFTLQIKLRRAEGSLKTSEERYELAVTGSDTGIWDWDIPSGTVYYSQRFKELLGYAPDEFPDSLDAFFDRLHPEEAETVRGAIDKHLQERIPYNLEYRLRTKSETYRWFHARGQAFWDEETELALRMSGVIHDITARKQDEEQLRKAFSDITVLQERLEQENVVLREEVNVKYLHEDIIGQGEAIRQVLSQVEQVAQTNSTVLISGETGTGKELIARAIHRLSLRKDRPMVTVNCAALAPNLIENELFGREKGAYTGALSRQVGRFELANGSSIFLDEIGELPLELQAKLLRVLQEGQVERLGSTKSITVDVRIIVATNQDLEQAVSEGRFREDLYFRLNVFPISVPPLRERREDIPLLVWAFVEEFGERMGKRVKTIPRRNLERLQRYSWPGNIRQVRNVIEHAMILNSSETLQIPVPDDDSAAKAFSPLPLEEVERQHILTTLNHTEWRIKGEGGTADILKLHPSTLRARMKKLGITRPADS